jgi:hypothetical protein
MKLSDVLAAERIELNLLSTTKVPLWRMRKSAGCSLGRWIITAAPTRVIAYEVGRGRRPGDRHRLYRIPLQYLTVETVGKLGRCT